MVNKKISKMLGPVLGIMGFMLTIGVLEIPVSANDNVQANSVYCEGANFTDCKYYSININKTVVQNGFKVTLDKVTATKHKLKVIVKVESEKPFDKEKYENSIVQVTFGENCCNGGGKSSEYINDNTLLITIDEDSDEEEYPEKGELRVDVVFPTYKVNVGIDANVDFSESFKNTMEKEVSAKIPEFDFTLNKLQSDIWGTRIVYSGYRRDYSERENDPAESRYSSMILKIGDRMYKTRAAGSHSSGNGGNDRLITGIYEAEAATYERIKDAKDISIIPVVCDMSSDEANKIYEDNQKNGYNEKRNVNKETTNNVNYIKVFKFSDGSKGEIYNIERNDNTVKVYCKGNSEKESLLMASNMFAYYNIGEDKLGYNNIYDSSRHMSFYKDSSDDLGYVVELNNVEKDKVLEIDFESMISKIDRYKIGDAIQVSR
ncbi:hypothetical protein [Clostridium uliginosum]|uniref:DUF4179 domain-containing protein n=1 Tax=Clostridium uliginosum TaxID=119641 RepID=A0A1I1JUI0_9CLOT|nr:hypothetical protein [Clostridium uliginosum]SFC51622.1 hypothetical protein SAMN05421842_104156 [Clostridium uliginosum]